MVPESRTWRKRTPPQEQPQFFQKNRVVLHGGSSFSRFLIGNHPTMKPPRGLGVFSTPGSSSPERPGLDNISSQPWSDATCPSVHGPLHVKKCKSYSCNSGAVRPTENRPNVVLPDLDRAAARVKTHVHRKSSQKDSQRSLSSRFTVCAVYTARKFSVRSVSLASTEPWVPPTRLVRDSPLAICVCYCISYCIS